MSSSCSTCRTASSQSTGTQQRNPWRRNQGQQHAQQQRQSIAERSWHWWECRSCWQSCYRSTQKWRPKQQNLQLQRQRRTPQWEGQRRLCRQRRRPSREREQALVAHVSHASTHGSRRCTHPQHLRCCISGAHMK